MNRNEWITQAARLQAAQQPFALVTVLRAQAPTSGKAGDKAVVTPDGQIHGWIGGGCAQPAVIKTVRRALLDGQPRKIRKIGMMSSDTGLIHFDDVRVPQRNRIGEEGMGFIYQMKQFQEERLDGAARRLASIELIEETATYLRQRVAFGKPLLDNQFIQYKLAELKTEIEALRGLIYMATHAYVQGQDVTELASMAKLKAGRLGRDVADWCMQFQGGMGYTWDNRVSRAYRDYRLGSIGGGADEVMLMVIARKMGLMDLAG